jgi:CBS domain-containing protein
MLRFEAGQEAVMNNQRPVRVADAMRSSAFSVDENVPARNILAAMESAHVDELPVVAPDGLFRAMVDRRVVERQLYDRGDEDATAGTLLENADAVARTTPSASIDGAIDKMLAGGVEVMPVVSADDRLAGVLVLEDLRREPDLVEAVIERRRLGDIVAEAGVTKVMMICSLLSAGLGLFLFALWIEGPFYGLPRWVAWVDGLAAALAFVGALTGFAREMFAVPLWTVAGVGLCFAAAVGHAWRDNASATWLQFAVALVFFAMAAVIGGAFPRRRHTILRANPAGATSP